jgi:hypothetical protein
VVRGYETTKVLSALTKLVIPSAFSEYVPTGIAGTFTLTVKLPLLSATGLATTLSAGPFRVTETVSWA